MITNSSQINAEAVVEEISQDGIFETREEMVRSLSESCNGDLYIIGRICVEAMKTVLLGTKMSLIPVVKAAPAQPPQRPPPMKYTDLDIYKSPHYEYKDYVEDLAKCSGYKTKLLHKSLLPYVKDARSEFVTNLCTLKCTVNNNYNNITTYIGDAKRNFKVKMRDPDNLQMRKGVVAMGTALGYLIGSRSGIPRRIFFTGVGGFAAGALCFPKESDEVFRTLVYNIAKTIIIPLYNGICGKNFSLRERVPCSDDMPQVTNSNRKEQCPIKK